MVPISTRLDIRLGEQAPPVWFSCPVEWKTAASRLSPELPSTQQLPSPAQFKGGAEMKSEATYESSGLAVLYIRLKLNQFQGSEDAVAASKGSHGGVSHPGVCHATGVCHPTKSLTTL